MAQETICKFNTFGCYKFQINRFVLWVTVAFDIPESADILGNADFVSLESTVSLIMKN